MSLSCPVLGTLIFICTFCSLFINDYCWPLYRYVPDDIAEIAKSASVIFTFRSEQSIHCKVVGVIGHSQSVFSVVINDRKLLTKFAPLIFDELNIDALFDSGRHYNIQIKMSLQSQSQPVSILMQFNDTLLENLDQSCFACNSESSLRPIQIRVHDPPSTYLSNFNCSVQINSKYGHIVEGSSLWVAQADVAPDCPTSHCYVILSQFDFCFQLRFFVRG